MKKINDLIVKILPVLIIIFTLALVTLPVWAATDHGLSYVKDKGLVQKPLYEVVGNIIQWVIALIGLVLVVMIIYGGVMYATSAGNEQKIEQAKKILTYAIIGVGVIALAFAITRLVLNMLFSSGTAPSSSNSTPTTNTNNTNNTLTPSDDPTSGTKTDTSTDANLKPDSSSTQPGIDPPQPLAD